VIWVSAAVTLLVTLEKISEFGVSRYKVWRSRKDSIHVLCPAGSEAFESLPAPIRNLGPWTGGPEVSSSGCASLTASRSVSRASSCCTVTSHSFNLRPLTRAPSTQRMLSALNARPQGACRCIMGSRNAHGVAVVGGLGCRRGGSFKQRLGRRGAAPASPLVGGAHSPSSLKKWRAACN
jgi:hypothetical protein